MSRYIIEKDKKIIAYGYDRALGYFFDVYIPDEKGNVEQFEVEKSSLLSKTSNGEFVELMQKYKVDPNHIDRVALDLPI